MHALTIVQEVLRRGCPNIHAARRKSLLAATEAALHAPSHTLSNLARSLGGGIAVRCRVKRMDRMLGSRPLQQECTTVYRAIAQHWLRGNDTPLIVVDWTDLNASRSVQMIRASVAMCGRSLTLYEEVHTMQAATTPQVHQAFLARLKTMLPSGCQPIVITDAGFRSPWFRAVEAQDWHWVGRSRNRDLVREHGEPSSPWRGCKTLYAKATRSAQDLGLFDCVRNRPHVHRLVLVKRAPKRRFKATVSGQKSRSNHSQKQARAQSELVASRVGVACPSERSGHLCDLCAAHADRAGLQRHQECSIWFGSVQQRQPNTTAPSSARAHCELG
jgi:hypothetical protein